MLEETLLSLHPLLSLISGFRADINGTFAEALARTPNLVALMRGARRVERWCDNTVTYGFFRPPYGPGWALVGDAGDHKDPITGQGITDVFRDAQLMAEAIADGFAGRWPLAAALAAYEQTRDAIVLPMYEFTNDLAELTPPPSER